MKLDTELPKHSHAVSADAATDLPLRFIKLLEADSSAQMFHFADARGLIVDSLSRSELDQQARRIASLLGQYGLKPGDRALLIYSFSIDVVPALLGCFFAGVIPCPVAPPNPVQLKAELPRFEELASDSGCRLVLSNTDYMRYRSLANLRYPLLTRNTRWRHLPWLKTDGDLPTPITDRHAPLPDDIALLQYTSGSTSEPKGVMITFRNIAAQLDAFRLQAGLTEASRLVAWIPYYHDHCLVAGIFNVMFSGGQLYLMSPHSFMKNPAVWFELLTRVRATGTAAPNFAFHYALRKTTEEQRRRWDLSSIDIFQSGGEPILVESVDPFLEAFAVSGLRASAFSPGYGLAEHVMGVAFGGRERVNIDRFQYEQAHRVKLSDAPTALTLIGNGVPLDGVRVEIVDPNSRQLLEAGDVGEIWVDSVSKALGYWRNAELSREMFSAQLADDNSGTFFLRTGDLGFFHDGELFVSGRIKDLIIIRGRNIYPQDVELLISNSHPMLRPGRSVAFSYSPDKDQERLTVIAEVRDRVLSDELARQIVDALRQQVNAALAVSCRTVVLARPDTIYKTTSGKLQRRKTHTAYVSGELTARILWDDTLAGDTWNLAARANVDSLSEAIVLDWLVDHFALIEGRLPADINVDIPVSSFAIDSLATMGLLLELGIWSGHELKLEDFTDTDSLREMARSLLAANSVAPMKIDDAIDSTVRSYPLNPSQAWLLSIDGPVPHRWTIGRMIRTPVSIQIRLLQQALHVIMQHHEALRLRLNDDGDGWRQVILPSDTAQVEVVDLSDLSAAALRNALESAVVERQSSLNITDGPILRLVVFRLHESQDDRLLLLIHHVAVDAYGFELIANDLMRVYEQLLSGEEPAMIAPSIGYGEWMERLQAFTESAEISTASQHFIGMPSAPRLVKDNPDASNVEGDCQRFSCQLNRDISLQLLQILPKKTGLSTPVWLLTTLMQALYNCTNQSAHCFELVHHGRRDALPDTDLSRACGWMSINYPAYFTIDPQVDTVSQARSVQANLAALTHHGLAYGLLRFMHPDPAVRKQFEDLPQPEMKFMWYGQAQGMVQNAGWQISACTGNSRR